jgi:hypothetical protein
MPHQHPPISQLRPLNNTPHNTPLSWEISHDTTGAIVHVPKTVESSRPIDFMERRLAYIAGGVLGLLLLMLAMFQWGKASAPLPPQQAQPQIIVIPPQPATPDQSNRRECKALICL